MSSTNRGKQRNRQDNYPTPAWCVSRFLEEVHLPDGAWLEPCAGDGAIIRAVNRYKQPPFVQWNAWEIRKAAMARLEKAIADVYQDGRAANRAFHGNFLAQAARGVIKPVNDHRDDFDVAITNPPFSLAMEFLEACRKLAEHTVFLLRVNFLASKERADFMRANTPDVYVLPNRPSFTGKGTDSPEYCWMHWWPGMTGKLRILNKTPLEERSRGR